MTWSILFFRTLCRMKWDCPFFSQPMREFGRDGHGLWLPMCLLFLFSLEGGGRKAKLNHIYNKLCFSIREPKLESMVIKNKWDNMNWRATTNFASNVTYTTYAIVNTSPMIALLFWSKSNLYETLHPIANLNLIK